MNYKKVVEGIVRRDSVSWVKKILEENHIEYICIFDEKPTLEIEKNNIFYDVPLTIDITFVLSKKIIVGGVIDDSGIYHSVIWNHDRSKIIWFSMPETRKQQGIEQFSL